MEEPPRRTVAARVAVPLACVALALVSLELARYDHGLGEPFFWISMVLAPVVLIFGAAAAGARRWYGWPDLGPGPGRVAWLSAAVVAGVLVGTSFRRSDVEETQASGQRLARAIRAWRDARGSWPARLDEVERPVPRTRMGAVARPSFAWDASSATLSFPVGAGVVRTLDVATEGAAWRSR